jgi:aryl-alcohol dehydrogenase-like predicted oxidoreductase
MERRPLGRTGIEVSVIGLGTMTWGEQNTEAEAHAQLDLALERGVNLIDCAEMYPVPPRAETQGRTEAYLGRWLARGNHRERVVLATKIAGPGRAFGWIRDGKTRFVREHLVAACEASLRRLQTDVIDLYQLHWPERSTNMFGQLGYKPTQEPDATPPEETLRALADLVAAGKIRAIGLSNETPWGVHAFLRAADQAGLPRVASIQNPYNLLNRTFEIGLAEFAHREDVGLLAYSPLAMGVLTDKYAGGASWPAEARLTKFERFRRYTTPEAFRATARYVALAEEHGLNVGQMALAFVQQQPFLTSDLIGATTLAQLEQNLASADLTLPPEVVRGIEAIHRDHANPCP